MRKKRIKILYSYYWRIGRRIDDASVTGSFLQGEVACLLSSLPAVEIEPITEQNEHKKKTKEKKLYRYLLCVDTCSILPVYVFVC